jgi:hypothetical protein
MIYKKMVMGIVLNRKNMNRTGTEPSRMNRGTFPFHFKFLNFSDIIGMFETISHDRKIIIASRE